MTKDDLAALLARLDEIEALGERAIAEIRLVRCGHEDGCAHRAGGGCDCIRSRLRAILAEWDAPRASP